VVRGGVHDTAVHMKIGFYLGGGLLACYL
jgi:hypothetical protein